MLDLYNKKYDRETLKDNIYAVRLLDIVKTQIIDVTFAVRYILNKKYQLHQPDNITIIDILQHQPHITYEEIQKELFQYDSDDDSIDNFEVVSNKKNTRNTKNTKNTKNIK